jgi:hypothetical protein
VDDCDVGMGNAGDCFGSRKRLARMVASGAEALKRYLSATLRCSRESSAGNTWPIPPCPRRRRTTYGPTWSVGAMFIRATSSRLRCAPTAVRRAQGRVDPATERLNQPIQQQPSHGAIAVSAGGTKAASSTGALCRPFALGAVRTVQTLGNLSTKRRKRRP